LFCFSSVILCRWCMSEFCMFFSFCFCSGVICMWWLCVWCGGSCVLFVCLCTLIHSLCGLFWLCVMSAIVCMSLC
jgi:hypothetical protein